MSTPGENNPSTPAGESGVRSLRVTLPPGSTGETQKEEASIRIPQVPPPNDPPMPLRPGRSAARSSEPAAESGIGKPQLRAPELKLEAAASPVVKSQMLRAPRSARSIWAVRAFLFLGVAGALLLLYWSFFQRLLPLTVEHRDRALEMTRLADELERLRNRWSPKEIEEMKQRYERARSTLFDPSSDLAAWQSAVEEQARMRVLEAKIELGSLQPLTGAAQGLSSLTARVNIAPDAVLGSTVPPYARLLKFTEALAASPKRIDIIELNVTGDSNSVSQAHAVVELFAEERSKL